MMSLTLNEGHERLDGVAEQFNHPAIVFGCLAERGRRPAEDDHDVEIRQRGLTPGARAAIQGSGQRVGEPINDKVTGSTDSIHPHSILRGATDRYRIFAITCPCSGNSRLRWIRDTDPEAWADLVEFDRQIHHGCPHAIAEGKPLRGQFFIHRSWAPLDQVDLDRPTSRKRQLRLVTDTTAAAEDDDPDGCSPWSCCSGEAVTGADTGNGTDADGSAA